MIRTFINRPVLASVISIVIVLLGVIGINSLPITQYPDIAPPTITISANYNGADAQTVLESVIVPIEEQVNGVEGMTYISSNADNSGGASITVYFEQGVDPDIAAVNVQNRVARATPLLPAEVTRSGVVTAKQQTSALMYMSFFSTNKAYDDVFIQNYLNINVIPGIKRINGVGGASVFGAKDYAMRIWLDPQKLAAYNLVPNDVLLAINEQSTQVAPGQLGQNSGAAFQYVIKYSGKYNEVQQYKDIVIKAAQGGQLLRLSDIAEIELSAFSYASKGETNGNPTLSIGVFQTPGSNAQTIIQNIEAYLVNAKKSFPNGLEYTINYNTNEFLSASMEKVLETLFEAFILVFIVVFIFLQDFRSTLIPAIAVPVSIIGTFFFLNAFGFSINLLTLFAMILAIGIVVDDAIVVVEAVHAKMETTHEKDIKKITASAMDGITTAIVSITLVMAAVFIPITFTSGPSGVFYKQFGITLAVAIIISAINALTLSPMLCALFLKPHHNDETKKNNFIQRFYDAFNRSFNNLTQRYGKAVGFIISKKWIAILLLVLSVLGIWYANKTTPTGFVPNEDRKIVFVNVELPPGSSLDRTFAVLKDLNAKVNTIDGVQQMTYIAGRSFFSGSGNNNALGFIKLKDWEERTTKATSIEAITGQLFGLASTIPDARIVFFGPPSVPGFGISSGFNAELLDKTGGSISELNKVKGQFIGALMQRPEIQYVQSPLNTNYPQYELKVNVPQAKLKGVSPSDIFSALSGYIGGQYVADFIKYGKQFRVMLQASPDARQDLQSFNGISVRNNQGQMIPISQFIELTKVFGPQAISRFNLYNSASLSGAPNKGYSTGDAIKAVEEVAAQVLPKGFGIDYSGLTREEISSGAQTTMILLITIIFVFLILSAQYESFVLPFSIILSLPLGIMGAYMSQKLAGLEINIYFQIALIMLIGLLAKNAILIVEFALQERHRGETIINAAIFGAKARLRPILMTSFAFIVGLMPLVLSSGVGANGNHSLATGAAFGLLIGTILGVLVIPVLFVVFQTLQEKIKPLKVEHKN